MTFFIPTEVQEWNAKLLPYFKLTRSVTWISKQKSNQILLRLWTRFINNITAMNPDDNIVKFWLWSFFCFHLFSHIMWQDARFWSKFKYMAFLGLGWDTWHCSPNSFTGFIFQVWLSNDSGLLQLKKNRAANVAYVFAWSVEPNTCQFLKLKFWLLHVTGVCMFRQWYGSLIHLLKW